MLDFVCKGRRLAGDVSRFQEEPDFLEADFSLIKDPEYEDKSGSMPFEVSSVGVGGGFLLATDQAQIELAFSVRGKDVYIISEDFIAMSYEKITCSISVILLPIISRMRCQWNQSLEELRSTHQSLRCR